MQEFLTKAVAALSLLAAPMLAQQPAKSMKVAVLVVDGVELLDASGPAEVFVAASFQGDLEYEVYTVAPEDRPIGILGFGRLEPSYSFENCPEPDILVIPGGGIVPRIGEEKIMTWIKERSRKGCVMFSVCSGVLALAKVGLLDGKKVTTHQTVLGILRKAAPNTTVLDDVRYVDNGAVVTSAGVSAGIDAALHLVERFSGKEAAAKTALYLEWSNWGRQETGTPSQKGG